MTKWAAFDIETTGLYPEANHVIELALCAGGVVHSWLIKPPAPIEPHITDLTGITQEMLDGDGVSFEAAWGQFLDIAQNYGRLVGHNAIRFDWPFLKQGCVHRGLEMPEAAIIDTAGIFKGLCLGMWPQKPHDEWARRVLDIRVIGLKYNLAYASQMMGLKIPEGTHRAGVDAALTAQLYRKLLDLWPTKDRCRCGFRGGTLQMSATEGTVKCAMCGVRLEKVSLQEVTDFQRRAARSG